MKRWSWKRNSSLKQRLEWSSIPLTECGCVIWLGAYKQNNYGQLSLSGKRVLAHRASWMAHKGPIPVGVHVLHRCDVPSCINPDHLFLGNHLDNMRDMVIKNRRAIGNRLPQTKLTDQQVLEIRKSGLPGRELAVIYSVSEGSISMIKSGKSRRHVKQAMVA